MGFTPLEGLVMATRSGSVDPGLLLWLLERTGMAERELADALESGLLGLAGTADMREVLTRADEGERDAQRSSDGPATPSDGSRQPRRQRGRDSTRAAPQ